MSERWSKCLLAVEAFVLAVPITCLAALAALGSVASLFSGNSEPYDRAQAIVYLLPIAPLASAWLLIWRFLLRGRVGLRSTTGPWWWIAAFGALLAAAAALVRLCFDTHSVESAPTFLGWILSYYRELALGVPAVVPLTHLVVERTPRMSSNYRLERP
jgi:hypothetical protein